MPIKVFKNRDWSFSFSDQIDPFFNLAWENELLKGDFPEESHLFLYRNKPCIISGRFQVPWREMNFHAPRFLELTYVRRRSGGGTVYHDLGNWNFCIVRKGRELNRIKNLELIISVLKILGVEVSYNDRFDLVFKDKSDQDLKVSGSAFKQTKNMNLHHGTLLVEASLKDLKGTLGVTDGWELTGKGIASHPSPVTNLNEHGHNLTFDKWINAWLSFFELKPENHSPPSFSQLQSIEEERCALKSWQWRWGETPHHNISWNNLGSEVIIEIKKGQVIGQSFKGFVSEINLIGLNVCSGDDYQSGGFDLPDYFNDQLNILAGD